MPAAPSILHSLQHLNVARSVTPHDGDHHVGTGQAHGICLAKAGRAINAVYCDALFDLTELLQPHVAF
jgi:hypothetical protein